MRWSRHVSSAALGAYLSVRFCCSAAHAWRSAVAKLPEEHAIKPCCNSSSDKENTCAVQHAHPMSMAADAQRTPLC